eukprot:CAMPEP_0185759996 /NCGR_PEP_ID=MMETSP1174-20130828/18819_1 /TAXON_ID=35687 /ORGANISM="Dictyocha speculum, Strain CCMP1381" /LENGTH=83 /DNA_ID=CAMNT_0028440613 /DNA_START=256 /DNA_END=507 /DNA_ORIENTATION=-
MVHTDLYINIEAMLKTAAAIVVGNGISDVQREKPGIVADSSRPDNISFEHNGTSVALGAYTANTSTASNMGIDVDKLLDAKDV